MANTLTGLIPTLYQGLDTVSREQVGMIPAVSKNVSAEMAAINQTISSPVVPASLAVDIAAGLTAPDNGDAVIGKVDITISKSKMVPIRLTGEEEKALMSGGQLPKITQDRFTQAFRTIANLVEADLTATYIAASRAYGTAGTTPFASTIGDVAQMRKILVDNGAPTSGLRMVVDSSAGANLRSLGQFTYVNQSGTDETLRRGVLGDISGFGVGESAQTATHTAGTLTDVTVTGVNAVGTTSIGVTTAATTGSVILTAGDSFTIAGDTNKYIVTTDVTIGANTTGTIVIAEPGLLAATAGAEALTVIATSVRNMAFDQNAIQLVTRAPAMPEGGDMADDVMNVTDPISGITFQVAVYRQYRQVKYEVGLAWGVKAIKPEHMALLLG